jgi:hypothetical protein
MSVSYIPESVKIRLWGKAAGRCEYEGCNVPLWLDKLTQAEFNVAYIAHIIADRSTGPRGDPVLSEQLKSDLSNLMLMCDTHHRRIDHDDVAGHPVERLRAMKDSHEQRVELVGALGPEKRSHVILYGANIGQHNAPLSLAKAADAMLPEWYPAEARPISLGMSNSVLRDAGELYWDVEAGQLKQLFEQQVKPRLAQGDIHQLSVFGLAPQPLLMLLGYLLCDIPAADVYQLHREPPNWRWQTDPDGFEYRVEEPATLDETPALVFSLSATIADERIHMVLPGAAIWKVIVPDPNNDFLKGRGQAQRFRETIRRLLNRIKAAHGEQATIHVFPAMPVALAVEFGRVVMPKADLPLRIYDQNQKLGGFVHALDLPA